MQCKTDTYECPCREEMVLFRNALRNVLHLIYDDINQALEWTAFIQCFPSLYIASKCLHIQLNMHPFMHFHGTEAEVATRGRVPPDQEHIHTVLAKSLRATWG